MKKLLAAALLCSAAATPVLAQSTRYYGAIDYGTVNISGSGTYTSPGALTVSAGYHFLPNLNAEAGITMIGDATANIPGWGRASGTQTIISAAAVGLVPVNSNFNLFGKAGLGIHNGDINGLPDDLILGFGGQILLDPKLSLRVQYESLGRAKFPSSPTHVDLTRLSLGVAYNF